MSKVIQASYNIWGTSLHSLWEVSEALFELNVSHSIAGADRTKKELVIDLGKPQPFWVHISPGVRLIKPDSYNLICAAHSALKLTNIPHLPPLALEDALKQVLVSTKTTKLEVTKLSAIDYIERVSKPSLLNKIQTEIYKIQPYGLRKEVQGKILKFFNSQLSEKVLTHYLARSFKTEGLVQYIQEGRGLRDAVLRLKNETADDVAAATGYSTFELLYLNRT